ncbi:dihydrolipoyl dehydrogenase family protein [Massilia putida]|uniref:dihydrolipoyl dehydrogenase family protein n=1 Tax=Massilia putida TaxID=1141883 RepID=UPI000950FA22|nr:NAD(P)/FAD-dependent oxidoreductase [Massilia putida]
MRTHYDLAIIGSGTAATTCALAVAKAGLRVTVIDVRRLGGTCALRGCDPKKVMVATAGALDHVRRATGKGIQGQACLDWADLLAFKRTFTDPVPQAKEELFAKQGIATIHGHASFIGERSLDVDGRQIDADRILIAAGAEPVPLGIPGEDMVLTIESVLALDLLPRRMLIVGGGYIAAELSHIAARAGAQVTIVHEGEHILEHFAAELVGWLRDAFDAAGIAIHTATQVIGIERQDRALLVHALHKERSVTFEVDAVVHGAGRRPDFDSMNLQAAGIDLDHGRLKLNEYLQSASNTAVYAAGDAAGMGPPLTPVAAHDGAVVADNILKGNHRKPDYRAVPSVAFTIPPIASVGLSGHQASELQLAFDIRCQDASAWFSARAEAQQVYGYKILVEKDTGKILGAHLVGPHADELINLFSLAIRHDLTADQLKATMFAYPTGASDIASML